MNAENFQRTYYALQTMGQVDAVPQGQLDAILWKSVYGADSTPPPPGPDAERDE